MNGSPKTQPTREHILAAMKTAPPGGHYVWDGKNEDERPLTTEELQAGLTTIRRRGRPAGTSQKEQVAIRFDRDIVAAFRASGSGWQTRMNDALRDWLQTHTPKAG